LEWNDIVRVVSSIAGFVGIGGALLWLFGRSFYSGLSVAFRISSVTVSLATEDYLEKGTTELVYFILDILFTVFLYYLAYLFKVFYYEKVLKIIKSHTAKVISILLVFTIGITTGILLTNTARLGLSANYFYEDSINLLSIFMIFAGLETGLLFASSLRNNKSNVSSENQSIVSPNTPIAIARILILIAMLGSFLSIQTVSSYVNGYMAGCTTTLRKATSVVIYSNRPILTEGQTQTQDLYVYTDYFLLFTDKDNYFLFREVDPESSKPKFVFVVSKDVLETIRITGNPVSNDEVKQYNEMCVNKIRNG